MQKPILMKVPRKTLKAITFETGEPETGFTNHTVQKSISCAMSEQAVEVNPTHHVMTELMKEYLARLPVAAWMNRYSSRDAVTEWICLGLSMDEDDAGLNDD